MDYLNLDKEINKLAQQFGLGGKIRETINLGGNWMELTNSEFKSMMTDLRTVDTKIRNLVTGENTSHESLKKILKTIEVKLNRKDYVVALSEIIKFYDIVCDTAEELKQLDPDFLRTHYQVLSSELSGDQIDRLFSLKNRPITANKKYQIVKQAGILDFLYNTFSSRGRTLSSWEKKFPKNANKLKRAISALLRSSTSIYNSIINSLKKMKDFRIDRKIEDYLEEKKRLLSRIDTYKSQFNSSYNSEIKGIIENIERSYTGATTESASRLPSTSVQAEGVTPPEVSTTPVTSPTAPVTPAAAPAPAPAAAPQPSAQINNISQELNSLRQELSRLSLAVQRAPTSTIDAGSISSQIQSAVASSERTINQNIARLEGLVASIPRAQLDLSEVTSIIQSIISNLSTNPPSTQSEAAEASKDLNDAARVVNDARSEVIELNFSEAPLSKEISESSIANDPDAIPFELDESFVPGTLEELEDQFPEVTSIELQDLTPPPPDVVLETPSLDENLPLPKHLPSSYEDLDQQINISTLSVEEAITAYKESVDKIKQSSNKRLNETSTTYLINVFNQIVTKISTIKESTKKNFARQNSKLIQECQEENPDVNKINEICDEISQILQKISSRPETLEKSEVIEPEPLKFVEPSEVAVEPTEAVVPTGSVLTVPTATLIPEKPEDTAKAPSAESSSAPASPPVSTDPPSAKVLTQTPVEEAMINDAAYLLSSELDSQSINKLKSITSAQELNSFLQTSLLDIIKDFNQQEKNEVQAQGEILEQIKTAQKIKKDKNIKEYQKSYVDSYKNPFTTEDVQSYTGKESKQSFDRIIGLSLETIIKNCLNTIFNKAISNQSKPSIDSIKDEYRKLIKLSLDLIINSKRNIYYSDEEIKLIIFQLFQEKYKQDQGKFESDPQRATRLSELSKKIFEHSDGIFSKIHGILRRQGQIEVGKDVPISGRTMPIDDKYLESDDLSSPSESSTPAVIETSESEEEALAKFLSERSSPNDQINFAEMFGSSTPPQSSTQESQANPLGEYLEKLKGESNKNSDIDLSNPPKLPEIPEVKLLDTEESLKIKATINFLSLFSRSTDANTFKFNKHQFQNSLASVKVLVGEDLFDTLMELSEITSIKEMKEKKENINQVLDSLKRLEEEVKAATQKTENPSTAEASSTTEPASTESGDGNTQILEVKDLSLEKISKLIESLEEIVDGDRSKLLKIDFNDLISHIGKDISPIVSSIKESIPNESKEKSEVKSWVIDKEDKEKDVVLNRIIECLNLLNTPGILSNSDSVEKIKKQIKDSTSTLKTYKEMLERTSVKAGIRNVSEIDRLNKQQAQMKEDFNTVWESLTFDQRKGSLVGVIAKIVKNKKYNSTDLFALKEGLKILINTSDLLKDPDKQNLINFVKQISSLSTDRDVVTFVAANSRFINDVKQIIEKL